MTPRLPPELLSEILSLACVGEPPFARRRIRRAFRLVCREWHDAFDWWSEVIISEVDELEVVVKRLLAAGERCGVGEVPARLRVRRAYVGLVDKSYPRQKQQDELNFFLELATSLRALELESVPGVLSVRIGDNLDGLDRATLSRLDQLDSVALSGRAQANTLQIETDEIRSLVSHLPALRQLTLKHVDLRSNAFPISTDPLGPNSLVRRLTLISVMKASFRPSLFVPAPGPPLLGLSLASERLYQDWDTNLSELKDLLLSNKDTLTELFLLDPSEGLSTRWLSPLSSISPLLARLVNLRALRINPVAAEDLIQALAPLARLEDLAIVEGHTNLRARLAAAEVVHILADHPRLRRMGVSQRLVWEWSGEEEEQVAAAAARRGVVFVKI